MLPGVPRHPRDVLDVVELGDLRRTRESEMLFFFSFHKKEKKRNQAKKAEISSNCRAVPLHSMTIKCQAALRAWHLKRMTVRCGGERKNRMLPVDVEQAFFFLLITKKTAIKEINHQSSSSVSSV